MGIFLLLSHPDVNSWLLTFGFQLHNVIPGYPKPDTDAMEPSYELVHTQMKTQEWDNSKVTPQAAAHTSTIPTLQQGPSILPALQESWDQWWKPRHDSTGPAREHSANT